MSASRTKLKQKFNVNSAVMNYNLPHLL